MGTGKTIDLHLDEQHDLHLNTHQVSLSYLPLACMTASSRQTVAKPPNHQRPLS